MQINKNKTKAFTLVEMVVVIAIIGLLSSIIMVAINDAKSQSRVGKRVTDLREIQSALELYYHDYNAYPQSNSSGTNANSQCSESGAGWYKVSSANNLIPGLSPSYMATLPSDPSMNTSTGNNCYVYESDGINYKVGDYHISDMTTAKVISTGLEDPERTVYTGNPCTGDTQDTTPPSMSLYSAGAACW